MKREETGIAGAYVLRRLRHSDGRGSFERLWCAQTLKQLGLNAELSQISLSSNKTAGTLRGLHYQAPPHLEDKIVICLRGALFDVIADLREGGPGCGTWACFALAAGDGKALYVPKGCAHGFVTLEDDTDVLYQISQVYVPELARGVRWDDPGLAIDWPVEPVVISDRDRNLPGFVPLECGVE